MEGYKPITGKYNPPSAPIVYEIEPDTPLYNAIDSAYDKIELAPKTLTEIKSAKKYFLLSAIQLRYDFFKISEIKRKHVRAILENQSNQNRYTTRSQVFQRKRQSRKSGNP
ncbi:hypothetical protein [Pricia antarctica]|uniref:hypothetical protein n=1 Tax=Pricia antarctica TaxID=641691 RepID=UPI0011141AFE|nr:hypothetical protein [Pricia antarctica]